MSAGNDSLPPPNEQAALAFFPNNAASKDAALNAIVAVVQEFHHDRDLYVLQRHCESLARLLSVSKEVSAALAWIATQAELIDCRLISEPAESLDSTLANVIDRMRAI